MPKSVIMPKFEMAQESGTISRWLKNEGDPVEQGEVILEIETDKINMEVEAPATGRLTGLKAGPGEVIPIGQVIAYIVQPGETLPAERPAALEPGPSTAPAGRLTEAGPRATPVAKRVAASHGLDLQSLPAASLNERMTRADVESYLTGQAKPEPGKMAAVPAARRLARELGVDLSLVSGSGPHGRIQSVDVRHAAEAGQTVVAPEAGPALRRRVPLTGMRASIATRLTASVREAPQFSAGIDVVMSRALAVIDDFRATQVGPDTARVTLTAFLVKACAWALGRFPAINATFENDAILEWADINIGVAVTVEPGLMVPVIHQADALSLSAIAARLADLTTRARAGQLRPEDVQSGTFTLSNLGMFGVDRFQAILNPPQVAILAVGRVAKRPYVTADEDRLDIQPIAEFTLTADHRVIDGAMASRFLADLKQAIERPGLLL
ncbi:MAG TPA: dihydrolipoamide acetyltransferase family protein [Anaerolineae bacterium]|nr:dihydrolipoamide acetyltransferase family protein [Anaerolineae bacterium]